MSEEKLYKYFYIFIAFIFVVLLLVANSLDISPREANIYFSDTHSILWYLTHISTDIFGQNNIALRLPFILFYISSLYLAFKLSDNYFKKNQDRLISVAIFAILPGMLSAGVLVDKAIIVVFGILLYLYLYKLYEKEYYILLVFYLFIDNSFALLYLALFFYSLTKKNDKILMVVSLFLFAISMQIYGFDVSGKPIGYFLDTFAIFASIFSPFLFLYLIYVLYRLSYRKDERDLYWYISVTAILIGFIFSIRQKILISDFAPFVVVTIPLVVKTFLHSYRVRLKEFRVAHKNLSTIIILVLLINSLLIIFNKQLFLFINYDKHFAKKHHFIKELAVILHQLNINKISCNSNKLQQQLRFYGIDKGISFYLTPFKKENYYKKIDIKYFSKHIKTYYIKKIY